MLRLSDYLYKNEEMNMKRTFNITESELRNFVRQMVVEEYDNNQLNEWTEEEIMAFRKQAEFVEKARELVRNMGFETSEYDSDKPCIFKIYHVKDYSTINKLMDMLNNKLKCDKSAYERFRAEECGGLFQTDDTTYQVRAPWYSHSSFFNESATKKTKQLTESELDKIITESVRQIISENTGITKEEILAQGRPTEPHSFETDNEELWYKIGLYDGATAE